MHPDEVALSFNVSRSNVIKWVKQKQKLIDAPKSEYKNHLKIRRVTKHVNLYKVPEKKFKECRAKGYRTSFAWLWSRARTIYREEFGDESATVKHHVTVNFIKRYKLRMRKKQRSKNVSKEDMRAKMMEWHTVLREKLIRTRKQDDYDEKWSRFPPECRFNVDQSPCPFVFDSSRTYHQFTEDQHNENVRISQPGAGLDKRFLYKFVSVRKENNPHLGLCFVELETAYQKMNVLPGTKMFMFFFRKMRGWTLRLQ